jgi:hypothetical protein
LYAAPQCGKIGASLCLDLYSLCDRWGSVGEHGLDRWIKRAPDRVRVLVWPW